MLFQATVKKLFFNVWSGKQRVLMHFLTTRIKSLVNNFWRSGAVKIVFLCICAYFQTTKSSPKKIILFTSGVVENVFWCISRPPESSPLKNQFLTSAMVKNVFWCICAFFQTTRIKSFKDNFWTTRVAKNVF